MSLWITYHVCHLAAYAKCTTASSGKPSAIIGARVKRHILFSLHSREYAGSLRHTNDADYPCLGALLASDSSVIGEQNRICIYSCHLQRLYVLCRS